MQAVREITSKKVVYLFDNNKKVTITEAGLVTPLRALDIKPDTHEVLEVSTPPVEFVGNKLKFDGGQWEILDQEYYDEKAAERVRAKRDALLDESDYTVLPDAPVADVDAWKIYRQSLRDITTHANFPYLKNDDWPEEPTSETSSSS